MYEVCFDGCYATGQQDSGNFQEIAFSVFVLPSILDESSNYNSERELEFTANP